MKSHAEAVANIELAKLRGKPDKWYKPAKARKPRKAAKLTRKRAVRFIAGSSSATKIDLPIQLVSEANQREHWAVKLRRKEHQQDFCVAVFRSWKRANRTPGGRYRFTRLGPKAMDRDNNVGSFKHVQDALAKAIGIDDANLYIEYAQERSPAYGVRIEVL